MLAGLTEQVDPLAKLEPMDEAKLPANDPPAEVAVVEATGVTGAEEDVTGADEDGVEELAGFVVVALSPPQGVVGLAFAQEHRAPAEFSTLTAEAPQLEITQFCAEA